MNCISIMHIDEYYNIISNGKVYYPANLHYQSNTSVQCDRCYRNSLEVCIGYLGMDLCLDCVKFLTDKDTDKTIPVRIPLPLTTMNQNIYNNEINNITYMEQNIFHNNIQIEIRSLCSSGHVCIHEVKINGQCSKLDGYVIANKYWSYLNESQRSHFSKYKVKD